MRYGPPPRLFSHDCFLTTNSITQADASGANLYSIPDRKWDATLLESVVSGNKEDVQKVTRMVGRVERDPQACAGKIGKWFQEKYGFPDGKLLISTLNKSYLEKLISCIFRLRDRSFHWR
jgi:hypothetical protein